MQYLGFDLNMRTRPLTDAEVTDATPRVVRFIERVCVGMDYGLTHLNKNRAESFIWSEMSDEMREKYAKFILKRAKTVDWVASVVVQLEAVEGLKDDLDVAFDFGKRLVVSPIFITSNGGFGPWLKP